METLIANIGELIYTDPSAAYRAIVTTKELHDEYVAIRKTIESPNTLGIVEREAITTKILLQMYFKCTLN